MKHFVAIIIFALIVLHIIFASRKPIDPPGLPDFCVDEGYQPYGPCESEILK